MPRDVILGNGNILVNLDQYCTIRDIYYPYVGQYNHVGGHRCRVGVWTSDAGFAWMGGEAWDWQLGYEGNTLVGKSIAHHRGLGIDVHMQHAVHPERNILLSRVTVQNLWGHDREVRLFYGFDLRIEESDIGDTSFYNPYLKAMIHFKRKSYFLMSGYVGDQGSINASGIAQYGCGIKEFQGAEGAWRDAEDGHLSGNAIAQGSVDSIIGYTLPLEAHGTETLRQWLAVGESLDEVTALHDQIQAQGFDILAQQAADITASWGATTDTDLSAVSPELQALFSRSLQIIRTHIDQHGAIIAATDSDIMETARAHYAYMWPRDGALVAYALDLAGHGDVAAPFFAFCGNALKTSDAFAPDGIGKALMHKYGPDGTMGATWHPWVVSPGVFEVPIQEDGTALVVWALGQRLRREGDIAVAAELYERVVQPAGAYLISSRDTTTKLPLPSWDLWEERRGIHLYTTSTVIGALKEAAWIAGCVGDTKMSGEYLTAAKETLAALQNHFWDERIGRFVRTLYPGDNGELWPDATIDSSAFAVFAFGALPADDPRVAATMEGVRRQLWSHTHIGGIGRYERDYYFRVSDDFGRIPGNPWLICTLWVAEWIIATAKTATDLTGALDLLEWTRRSARPTGVLPEQVHPETGGPLSVAPLTWSHAQFVTTVLHYVEKVRELGSVK